MKKQNAFRLVFLLQEVAVGSIILIICSFLTSSSTLAFTAPPHNSQRQLQGISGRVVQESLNVAQQPLDDLISSIDKIEVPSRFYDIGYDNDNNDDDDDDDDHHSKNSLMDDELATATTVGEFADFERDEDAILEEREDRFYVDERGERRTIEKCILVGVEDLSAKRRVLKRQRQQQQQQQQQGEATTGYRSSTINNNVVEAEDMAFTLEESLTEMRELIKTAGMECVGGACTLICGRNDSSLVLSFRTIYLISIILDFGFCSCFHRNHTEVE